MGLFSFLKPKQKLCPNCGKPDTSIGEAYMNRFGYCEECIKQWKVVNCGNCVHYDIPEWLGECRKFGFEFQLACNNSNDHERAKRCKSYLTEEMALSLEPQAQAKFVVCKFCETQYDLNKYPRCPNCGATKLLRKNIT